MNKKEALIAEMAWRKLRAANDIGCKVALDKEVINALLIEHDECLKTLKEAGNDNGDVIAQFSTLCSNQWLAWINVVSTRT